MNATEEGREHTGYSELTYWGLFTDFLILIGLMCAVRPVINAVYGRPMLPPEDAFDTFCFIIAAWLGSTFFITTLGWLCRGKEE